MRSREPFEFTLPLHAVANPAFAFDRQVARAREFLTARGIDGVRPVYGLATASKRPRIRTAVTRLPVVRAANDATAGWSREPHAA
jgi:hypothetical protein